MSADQHHEPATRSLRHPYRLATALESDERLDRTMHLLDQAAPLLSNQRVRDALAGTWLGHSLHPLLTDLPLGAFFGASVLDVLGGRSAVSASRLLVKIGLVCAVPTIASGYVEWIDSDQDAKRVGVIHAGVNALAASLYGLSLPYRKRGRRLPAILLGLMGGVAAIGGGYLGGHLSLARGVGVNQTSFDKPGEGWIPACRESDVPRNGSVRVLANEAPVLVGRDGERWFAIGARCSHRGGPLDEGELRDGRVICPWHGSQFDLTTGRVQEGPAGVPQPVYEVRVAAEVVEIREVGQ